MVSRVARLYRTPTLIGSGMRPRRVSFGAGTRLGTGRTPMVLRSGRMIGLAANPYVRGGLITAASLSAARAALKKARVFRAAKRTITTPRSGTSKQAVTSNNTPALYNTRTLYDWEITDIGKTTTNNIHQRQRDMAYVSGFRICAEFRNVAFRPLLVNYAVLYDRRSNLGTVVPSNDDFFRAASGDQRGLDFNDSLTSHEFHCNPLNSDRFVVLKHMRFILGTAGGNDTSDAYTETNRENWKALKMWVPLKKKLTWEDGQQNNKIWLFMWCDRFFEAAGTVPQLNQLQYSAHVVAYFRDPKN